MKCIFLFITISFFCLNNLYSQTKRIITFSDEMSTHSINKVLRQSNLPFELSEDSINPFSNKINLYYKKTTNKIFSTYSNISSIFQIDYKQKKYYLILFYDYVGYDFFLLVQLSPFKLFKSQNYNFEQNEGYTFLDSSINIKDKTIKIKLCDSYEIKTIKMVKFQMYQNKKLER